MAHLSDLELITAYRTTKDDRFFAQLYTRHRYRVYQGCLNYCMDPDEANDFTQEIFMRLSHKIEGFNGNSLFTTWLKRVVTNYCIDQIRERQQRQTVHQRYVDEMDLLEYAYEDVDETHFQIIDQVRHRLPAHEWELLQSKYGEGFTLKDIAGERQLSLSAVKMRIKRARDQARSLYCNLYAKAE